MPWSKQNRNFTIVTIACLSLSNAILTFVFVTNYQSMPSDVYREVRLLRSDFKIANETTRTAIALNQDEIDRLRKQMQERTAQLKHAQETLAKLDPNYRPEAVYED